MRLELGSDLELARKQALDDVRNAANLARAQLLPGVEKHVLQMANQEAQDFLKSGEPGPWIQAEMKASGAAGGGPVGEMAAASELMRRYALWQLREIRIHEVHRTAELRIQAATRVRDIQAIVAGVTWPS